MTDGTNEEKPLTDRLYEFLADEEDARVCLDIPDDACSEQPSAFIRQLTALSLTQIGDKLISPRITLAWMLSALGAPAFLISLLVPVRESLALVPQLFIAQIIREKPLRKLFWVLGSILQASLLLLMIPAVLFLEPRVMGLTVIALLIVFSLARGICSVAAKDVLGKTVSKTRRGRLTGRAATISGIIVLATAAAVSLMPRVDQLATDEVALLFALLLALAAGLWFAAALVYSQIPEVPGATEGGGNAITEAVRSLALVRSDARLRDFIVTRSLLIATAFAIPYQVLLVQRQTESSMLDLAGLLVAEGLAGLLSGSFWGRLSDRASHQVMAMAAGLSTLTIAASVMLLSIRPDWFGMLPVVSLLLLLLSISHQGVRIARKTYLVDMATSSNRAQYTAVSNTLIGLVLFSGGGLGLIDARFGASAVMIILGVISCLAVWRALRLDPS